jgi:hypothetical protein
MERGHGPRIAARRPPVIGAWSQPRLRPEA